mmetsp:Transcript_9052/g.13111  ORF Transcript_9052/g.13111 Transcript_9052/m.13111 type:complete len:90 (+) Transcript_9052:34-303(+)
MNVYAKGSQIWSTFQEKHTGSQSIVTLTLNVVGIAVRILTTIGEVGFEMNWLASYFSSLCLNGTLFAQYWIYKDRTQKYWEEQAKQKKE